MPLSPAAHPSPGTREEVTDPGSAPPSIPARQREAEATETLVATVAGVLDFEAFVDSLDFLDPQEAMRVKLAGGEIFDNLVRHAAPLSQSVILARCSRRSGKALVLAFYFRSPGFSRFAASALEGRIDACLDEEGGISESLGACANDAKAEPFFDPLIGRWRGIGLRMCRNLTASFLLRSGSFLDRIFLEF